MEGETAQALPSASPQVACRLMVETQPLPQGAHSLMVETQPLPPAVRREQSGETQRKETPMCVLQPGSL